MYLTFRRVALITSLIGLVVLISCMIYRHNLASYTANLDTRAFSAGLLEPINSLEPAMINCHQERLIASAMYEGLVYYDEKAGSLKPRLAKSWKYSTDGKSLVLNLDKSIKFSNGKKLQASDVKRSWENNFSKTMDWSNISLFLSINGSSSRLEGKTADITGIKVVNDHTLKILFDKPNAVFIYMLTNPIFWVYDDDDKVTPAPGTGPFMLTENKDNKQFILLRNDKYHQGQPRLSALNITIYSDEYQAFSDYKAGKLDYLDTIPLKEIKNVKNNKDYKGCYISKALLDTYALGFNLNKEPFADNYQLRRALNYAIDRKAIIDNILGGACLSIRGVLPIGITGYNRQMPGYDYNPEKAKKLLEEAGYPMGEGLKPLVLTYNNDEGHTMIAGFIVDQLSQLGIEVQLQPMEWDYYKKQLGKMDIAFFRLGWHADYPDADNFLYSLFHSSKIGISNFSGYYNPQVDKILDASREEHRSHQERIKLLNRAEEIIVDDAPCLWLFQYTAERLKSPSVNGLNIDNMGMIDWYKVELLKPSLEDEGTTNKI
ncbi:MAG: ABC transporter substrate-binding protein [Syntrophomonadaceae bacterium]|nr:ABC transporter substrate-binding protein [Syntrophomonadaceae bacterium]